MRRLLAVALLALLAAVPTAGAKPRDITIAVAGDLLVHDAIWEQASLFGGAAGYDFAPIFRRVRPLIAGADLAVCHMETPLLPGPPTGYPVFSTPPALARAVRATGWDACTTASNHSLDQGERGIASTLRVLDANGIRHAGTARSAREAARPLILETADGIRVALLSYTQVSNGQEQPRPWLVNALGDDARPILREAARARRLGAQVVVVNIHWGEEYRHAPTATQLRVARALGRSRLVTAVVGQHAHVVQPIRWAGGGLVLYGEGNLISAQGAGPGMPAATQDGLIGLLRIRVPETGPAALTRIDYAPVFVRRPDHVVIPVGADRSQPEYRESWDRTLRIMGRGARFGPWRGLRP